MTPRRAKVHAMCYSCAQVGRRRPPRYIGVWRLAGVYGGRERRTL